MAEGAGGRRGTEAGAGRGRRRAPLRSSALAVAVLAVISGCSGRAGPELLRRYASYEVADTTGLVGVAVFSVPASEGGSSTRLPELSPSAQSALIRAVADKTDTPEAFLHLLGRPVGASADSERSADRTRFRRRVVVSAENRVARPVGDAAGRWRASPGARISRLRVAIGLEPGRARFRSWDRFASRYETVDLGAMSFRRERSSGLALDVAPGNVAGELDLVALESARASTLDEELPLRSRYVSTGMLLPDSMILLQEGAVGVDLTGNVVVEVEIDVVDAPEPAPVHSFVGLFGGDGAPRPPDSVRVASGRLTHAPAPAGDLRGTLRFEAVVRTVRSGAGDATWAEGDDHVRYLVETARRPGVTLLRGSELRASVWQLATPGCRDFLHVQGDTGDRPEVVQLASADEAFALLRWLQRSRPSEAGRRALYLGPERPLAPRDADDLAVRLLPLNWEAGPSPPCP